MILIKESKHITKGTQMNHFIIVKGKSLIASSKVSKRTQKFVSYTWTSDPRDAQTYGIGDAKELAVMCGGEVLPYSQIVKFHR